MAVYRILLIDDDSDDYEIFSEIVHELDADTKVLYVQDADDIDNFLVSPLPEIIILDFNMPKLDGMECLKKIRSNKALDKIPVIIYSGFYDKVDEAYKNGANYFIAKQTSIDSMKKDIKKVLTKNWNER
jgi:DNA-binding NtrC family response regulator